jgi:hypothetical protein
VSDASDEDDQDDDACDNFAMSDENDAGNYLKPTAKSTSMAKKSSAAPAQSE